MCQYSSLLSRRDFPATQLLSSRDVPARRFLFSRDDIVPAVRSPWVYSQNIKYQVFLEKFCIIHVSKTVLIIAKLSLNSTQLQLNLRLRLALIPLSPATRPPTHPATHPE